MSDELNDDVDTDDVDHVAAGPDGSGPEEGPEEGPSENGPDLSAAAPEGPEHTGNPVVDSVLDSLRNLEDVPVSEHVAVFEAAHDRLRSALSDAGNTPTDS